MSYSFSVFLDAVRLPSPPEASHRFQALWNLGRVEGAEGATSFVGAATGSNDIVFRHEATFEANLVTDHLLHISVVRIPHEMLPQEKEVVGVLVMDLHAHRPKGGESVSRQRATVPMSLCDPPLLMRIGVSCTSLRASSLGMGSGAVVGGASSQPRARSATPGGGQSDYYNYPTHHQPHALSSPLPLPPQNAPEFDESAMEVARLRAAVQSLTNANRQLRDENTLLRTAVQRARAEPSYSYGGGGNHVARGTSPMPPTPRAASPPHPQPTDPDQMTILQAEIAVLQRGLSAAKDRLRQGEATEAELRAELKSLLLTSQFQTQEIQRLERDLTRAEEQKHFNHEARTMEQRKELNEMSLKLRSAMEEANTSNVARERLVREHEQLQRDFEAAQRRREVAEASNQVQSRAFHAREQSLTEALDAAKAELETLHAYAAAANDRCRDVSKIVESQAAILVKKNGKIRALQSLLESRSLLDKAAAAQSNNGRRPNASSSSQSTGQKLDPNSTLDALTTSKIGEML